MKYFTFVFAACLALVCTSCRNPTAGTRVESYRSTMITPNSRIVNKNLQIESASAGVVNGLLRVEVKGLSLSRKALQYEYRFRWLDSEGFEIDAGTRGWTSVFISSRDKAHMQGVAPNARATDFEFVVRFPDRI